MSLFPELDELEKKQERPSLFPELDELDSVGVINNQNSPRLLGKTTPPSVPSPLALASKSPSIADGDVDEVEKSPLADYLKDVAQKNLPLPVQGALGLVKKAKEQADETSPEIEKKRGIRQELAETLTPTVDPVSKLLLRTEPGQRMAASMASGGLGITKNAAAFVPAVEQFLTKKQGIASEYGQKAADTLGKIAQEYMPENPNYIDKLAAGSTSLAIFAPIGVGSAAGFASLAANIPKMGALLTKLAPAVGSTVAALTESSIESGGVYDDMIKKGASPEVAAKAAFSDWWQNVLLTGLTNRYGLFAEKYKGVKKALVSVPIEALQESYQNVIASLSKDELPDWKEVAEEGVIGGILGGIAGPLVDVSPSETQTKSVPRGTVVSGETLGSQTDSYLKTNFPQLREGLENKNVPLSQEELQSLLAESAVAGEEVLLKGGTPEQADQAAQEVFARRAQPAFEQREAEAFAEEVKADKKAERPSIEDSLNALSEEFGTQNKQTRGKLAAEAVLKSNKIDDRVIVDLVDEILVDETAFKAGYGEQAEPDNYKFLGETKMSPDAKARIQAVIQLAKGSDEATGRHEAFHAVSNILLDKDEQNVITKKYGDMEKAADAFGEYRKNNISTGSSVIDAIFEKFKMFLERIGNYFETGKFKSAEDLFKAIEEGRLANRASEQSREGKFIGYQEYGGEAPPLALFNVPEGHPNEGSTVDAEELKNMGIGYKEPPAYAEWRKRMREQKQYSAKTRTNTELEQKAVEKFGLTNDLNMAGFVLGDGRMLDFKGRGTLRGKEHRDVASLYDTPMSGTGTQEMYDFMNQTKAARIRSYEAADGKHLTIETQGPLSQDQLRQISDYLATNKVKDAVFDVVDFGGMSLRDDTVANPTGEDVARFFNGSSLYSAKPKAPTFYSQLQKVLETKLPARAMPDQINNILNGQDVKKDEVEWSGIKEWLDSKKGQGSIPKQDVIDFLKQNQVGIQEVMKGGIPTERVGAMAKAAAVLEKYDRLGFDSVNQALAAVRDNPDYVTRWDLKDATPEEISILNDWRKNSTNTKFERYTLPGGENYRELLLTLPEKRSRSAVERITEIGKRLEAIQDEFNNLHASGVSGEDPRRAFLADEKDRLKAEQKQLAVEDDKRISNQFRSSHFSEPNILAHVRFNDRTDADGKKVLFIEEIQSDWHQKGREKGYSGALVFEPVNKRSGHNGPAFSTRAEAEKYIAELPEATRRDVEIKEKQLEGAVPNAPFKKTWHELALKRMLRYAAENGYDQIAWTTGEQQAERYNLSKQVRDINYVKVEDKYGPRYEIWATDNDGRHVDLGKNRTAQELPDLVGKQVADKIIESEGEDYFKVNPKAVGIAGTKTLSGVDLKIGGEGMKGFYDSIIPAFLNKYAKKWGGKVERAQIETGPVEEGYEFTGGAVPTEKSSVHSLEITDSMKDSVLTQGQPLYSAQPKPDLPTEGFNDGKFEQTKWDRVKQELYDRFSPIKYKTGKEIQPEMKKAGGLYTRAYVMARELNGKIRGISESLLKDLNERIKPLKNAEDRQILNKIYSLRNLADLDRIGKTTSGIKIEDVTNQLEQLKEKIGAARFDRISKVADGLADIQNNKALNILVEGKVITPKVAETLRERYPNYLRSEIMDEALATTDPQFKRADNGEPLGRINKSFLKTKQGTEMQINDDVLDVIRRSLVTKVAAAQKQLVIDQIAEDFGKEVGRQRFEEGSLVSKVNPKAIPPGYVKSSTKASGGRIFAVRQDVADLLEGLNQKQADFITKAMSSYNRLFRAGATTLRVPFLFNNVFRDVQESLFKARSIEGQKSQMASYVKGAFHAMRNTLGISDQVYKNWIEAGGAYGGIVSSIPKTVDVPFRLKSPVEKLKVAAQGAVTLPFEAIAKLAEFSENTSRLAEWIRLEGAPLHPELRALQSRDITVDFEKVGDAMKRINQVVPFLNANIQGTVNDLRAFRDQPALSVGRMIAYIILPAILGYEWNKRFENEEDVDPYIKNAYWHFNTGIEVEQDGKKLPALITIRKGAFAQTVSYYVNALLEYANNDPNFKQKLKDFTAQGTLDSLIASVVPPVMRLPIEQAANKSFFTGRPIITQSIENVERSKQFKPATTNTARRMGELTGISPARFEHALTGAFPAAQQILEANDAVFRPNPEIKRKDTRVFPLQSVFPAFRTPSGFFNQKEEAAKEFERSAKTDVRTKNFLFEQSVRQFMQDKTPENHALLMEYMQQVDRGTRTRVLKKIAQEQRMKGLPPEQRGLMQVAKKRRAEFLRQQDR